MAGVTLSGLRKAYGRDEVIHGVDLDITDGEFVVLVGPSGCGKSTLLRMIAGLEEITDGVLSIGGVEVNDLPPAKRGVAMVFQSYALYPHMTAYQNMAFGMKLARQDRDEIDRRVREVAATLELTELLDRLPRNLSGGQRQRVAIGRAIVRDPEVFLFDEPLSNLDASLRTHMRVEIARLHDRLGGTTIYVTHDQTEAMTLADRIVVLNQGRIEQVGTPLEVYENPANRFVAGFIGAPQMNFLPVKGNGRQVQLPGGAQLNLVASGDLTLGIRPEHISVGGDLQARIDLVENVGDSHNLHMVLADGTQLVVKGQGTAAHDKGDNVGLAIDVSRCHLFDVSGRATSRADA